MNAIECWTFNRFNVFHVQGTVVQGTQVRELQRCARIYRMIIVLRAESRVPCNALSCT